MANTTLNPSDKTANVTLTGGNLIATGSNTSVGGVRAVDRQVTGKFYWEVTRNVATGGNSGVGFTNSVTVLSVNQSTAAALNSCSLLGSGVLYIDGVLISGSFGAQTNGSVVCVAADIAARLVWMRIGAAGNWNAVTTANPATGVGGFSTGSLGAGIPIYPTIWLQATNDQYTANFGTSAFTGTVPAGFTSGFTSGATPAVNTVATQIAAEQWYNTNPDLQLTQIGLEQWATVGTVTVRNVMTQIAIEQWASVAVLTGGQSRVMVLS